MWTEGVPGFDPSPNLRCSNLPIHLPILTSFGGFPASVWSSGACEDGQIWNGLPSGYVKIAIENGHRNSGFTHWKWWFSHSYVTVYQRVAFLNYVWTILNLDVSRAMDSMDQSALQLIAFFPMIFTLNKKPRACNCDPLFQTPMAVDSNLHGTSILWLPVISPLDDWMYVASVPTLQIGPSDWDGESWDEYFSEGVWKPPVGVGQNYWTPA